MFFSGGLQIPSYAAQYGINSLLFSDDFMDDTKIDKNNTLAPGFNWYISNVPSRAGVTITTPPVSSSMYSVSNSVLTITDNPAISLAEPGGEEFMSIGYDHTDPTINVRTLPLISGTKPFYIEANMVCGNGTHSLTFWLFDSAAWLRIILNTGNNAVRAEFDIVETNAGGNANRQTLTTWNSPNGNNVIFTNVLSGGFSTSAFNKWGLLVVPAAYNSGTGFSQFYLNGNTSGSATTWTNDLYGVEASNYMLFMGGGNSSPYYQMDYIRCFGIV
jgi:hypothetical protein